MRKTAKTNRKKEQLVRDLTGRSKSDNLGMFYGYFVTGFNPRFQTCDLIHCLFFFILQSDLGHFIRILKPQIFYFCVPA